MKNNTETKEYKSAQGKGKFDFLRFEASEIRGIRSRVKTLMKNGISYENGAGEVLWPLRQKLHTYLL